MGPSETACSAPGLAAVLNHCQCSRPWLKGPWHSAVTNERTVGDSTSRSERQKELWLTELEHVVSHSYKSYPYRDCNTSNMPNSKENPSTHHPFLRYPQKSSYKDLPSARLGHTHSNRAAFQTTMDSFLQFNFVLKLDSTLKYEVAEVTNFQCCNEKFANPN